MISFRTLLEEILGILDYYDSEGVALSYHLYQSACKGSFDLEEILREHLPQEPEKNILCETKEEMVTQELVPEENDKEERKPGFLKKILQFFLKKQEVRQLPELLLLLFHRIHLLDQ